MISYFRVLKMNWLKSTNHFQFSSKSQVATFPLEVHDEGPNEFMEMLVETERSFLRIALHVKILTKAFLYGFSLQANTKGFMLELAIIKI